MEDRDLAVPELVGVGLETMAHQGQRVGLAPAHGDDEPVAEEDHDLAGLDVRGLLEVAQGLEHHEDRVVVQLDLGALVALDGVLHRQRVQLELVVDEVELLVGGVLQPDPQEVLGVAADAEALQLVTEVPAGAAPPVAVDGLVNDHRRYSTTSPSAAHAPTT